MRHHLSGSLARFLLPLAAVALISAPAAAQPAPDAGAPAPAAPEKVPPADPFEGVRSRFNLEAVQGLLAVQHLDGWLLCDVGGEGGSQNPIARALVNPEGELARRWFYLIPAKGQPIALVHRVEAPAFDQVPGRKLEYAGYRDLEKGLRTLLKGAKSVAMEYSPKGGVGELSRVDAGTIELVKSTGVTVRSSAELVQFTRSLWGPDGRKAHYIAAHHLSQLRKDALAFIKAQIAAGRPVSEWEVAARIAKGFKLRGLVGPAPVVASGNNTADPQYVPTARRSSPIQRDDLVLISLAGKLDDETAQTRTGGTSIMAAETWVAFAGTKPPVRYVQAFDLAGYGRNEALNLIRERAKRRRPVKGFEPDQQARSVIGKAGYAENFIHRTGHSLDGDLYGAGANLDDYETHDQRNLVVGSGFTVGPGLYFRGDFGVRAEVSVFLGQRGVEVTTPLQDEIEILFPAPPAPAAPGAAPGAAPSAAPPTTTSKGPAAAPSTTATPALPAPAPSVGPKP
jgi:Xaa-Pro aminopeptidase